MKKGILICLFVLLCGVACNSATRGGTKTAALKAGMPNTLALPNGEVVYDLSGEWDAGTKVSTDAAFSGIIKINQKGDRFVGTLQSGNYPALETFEKVRGTLKGADIMKIEFNTPAGWILSYGEIGETGNKITIDTQWPTDNVQLGTTLRRK